MRIAAISDIHANLVALETVLNDLAQQCFDRLVFLGDAAVFGPQPRGTGPSTADGGPSSRATRQSSGSDCR